MSTHSAKPNNLSSVLSEAQPGDTIFVGDGEYFGSFGTPKAGNPDQPISVIGSPDAVFIGAKDSPLAWNLTQPFWSLTGFAVEPVAPAKSGQKPTWISVRRAATGTQLHQMIMRRNGDIEDSKRWNDYGIIIEANDVLVNRCSISGMTKPIHLKGPCVNPTVIHCHIGPSYQSGIVIGTSFGVMRAGLIAWNTIEESHIEDGIQWMQNFNVDAQQQLTDVSNLGMIVYQNVIRRCRENALDFKGAGSVVVDGNVIEYTAGSANGALNGWNLNSDWAIGRGARTSCENILLRNNQIRWNVSGIRLLPADWRVIHNQITDNNWRPETDDHEGYGIRQPGDASGAVVLNNVVSGHKKGNLVGLSGIRVQNNPESPESLADPLTFTASGGAGRVVKLEDAGFWSAWFGRQDLPAERIFVGEDGANVVSVNHLENTVTIDRDDLTWAAGSPVGYMGHSGRVGPVEDVPPPTEPELPQTESLTVTGSPASVAMLRAVLTTLGDLRIED